MPGKAQELEKSRMHSSGKNGKMKQGTQIKAACGWGIKARRQSPNQAITTA